MRDEWGQGRLIANLALLLSTLLGLAMLLWPFFASAVPPLAATLLLGVLVLVVGLGAVQGQELDAKGVALLAVLAALNGALRLLPTFGGASPIFFLLLVGGYVFGAGFGFLFGALTIFVSAIVTGGFGPWLPYQMLAAAWLGASAGLLGRLLRRWQANMALNLTALGLLGLGWGLLYGALLNLWFWPASADATNLSSSGLERVGELVSRFTIFYFATSFAYDLWRSALNLLLVLTLGGATLKILYRFQRRFYYTRLTTLKEDDYAKAVA